MKRLYERYYQEDTKLLQLVAVLPWGHNLLLLDKSLPANEAFKSSYNLGFLEITEPVKEYAVDMLFFHRGLRSLVAIDILCCAQHNSS